MSSPDTSVGPPKRQKMSQELGPEDDEQDAPEPTQMSPETCEIVPEQSESEPPKEEKIVKDEEQESIEGSQKSPEHYEIVPEQLEENPPKEEDVVMDEEQEQRDEVVKGSERPPTLVSCYDSDGSVELNESFDSDIDDVSSNQQIEAVWKPADNEGQGNVAGDQKTPEKLAESPEELSFDTPMKLRLEESAEEDSPPPRPDTPLQRRNDPTYESENVPDQLSLDNLKDLDLSSSHQKGVNQVELEAVELVKPESPVSEDYLAESPEQDDPLLRNADGSESPEEFEETPEREYVEFLRELPNGDGTVRIVNYDELTAELYNSWFVNRRNVSFRPDFRKDRYNERNHYIYCNIPGYRLGRVFRPYARCVFQIWAPEKTADDANSQRARRLKQRNKMILENYINSYLTGGYQLFAEVLSVLYDYRGPMPALERYFHEECERTSERAVLEKFRSVAEWAYRADELFGNVNKIYQINGTVESATFSQQQCAAIVAWMFLTRSSRTSFGPILVGNHPVHVEKLRFMFTYFEAALTIPPGGTVSFRKVKLPEQRRVNMFDIPNDFQVTILDNDLKIEETALCTQVDFANMQIGGGVLRDGAVQEEIRFLMCPEMMVAMRLASPMNGKEAISIVGAQAFSSYTGYSWSLKWAPLGERDARQNNPTFRDHYGRLRVETIAIDALNYNGPNPLHSLKEQLKRPNIEREFTKAYLGFSSQGLPFPLPIVSGWWGCGAFRGHKPLKLLIQACAAAKAGRRLWICKFGDDDMAERATQMFQMIQDAQCPPSEIMQTLVSLDPPEEFSHMYVFDALEDYLAQGTSPSPGPSPGLSPGPGSECPDIEPLQ